MKIIIVHPLNPLAESTWSRIPFFLGNALKNLGVEIIPVTTGPSSIFEKYLFLLIQFVIKLDYTYSTVFRRLASIKLMNAINKHRPDAVLHFASTSAIPSYKLNIPQYLYIDNTWNLLITESSAYMTPKPADYQILNIDKMENIFFHRFSKILSQTTRVSQDLHNHYGLSTEKIIQVGHGIGNIIPNLEEKDYSKKQIIFIARHSFKQKGGELMLNAVRIAQKKMPDIKLVIEGDCEITGNIDDIKNLSITGLSDVATLQKLLRESCLLVMPALAEPLGIVYMEAMARRFLL
jgi:glycosyltransferase involved in cell wall biosynthesis